YYWDATEISWTVKKLDKLTAMDFSDENSNLPTEFILNQNYPNPFNPKTIINYELPTTLNVDLSVYNLLGQKVATLVSGKQSAGHHQVEWNAGDLPSGVYYYILKAGGFHDVKKMVLLR
ncbi:T9SS type A sorting domain-containing protein, partial [bacterium]|nr:T9SS type A sorting domain-containing protein [bacterium]